MLTLIKRELQDNLLLFIIAAILNFLILLGVILAFKIEIEKSDIPLGMPTHLLNIWFYIFPIASIIFASFGATQMYSDQTKKISTFLSTLAVTRNMIWFAKMLTGLLMLIFVFLPLVITVAIFLSMYPRVVPPDMSLFTNFYITAALASTACYFAGLSLGWNQNKFFPVLGSLGTAIIILSFIAIKGIGIETQIILILIALCSALKSRYKFMTSSL